MVDFVQNMLDGIAVGSAYSLLALGFTLIFGAMGRLNIAFGPSIMIGVFAGAGLSHDVTGSLILTFGATLLGTLVATVYVERLSFAAVKTDAALASMVSTFAIWMQFDEIIAHLFPFRTYAFRGWDVTTVSDVGPFVIRHSILFNLAIVCVVVAGLRVFLHKSYFGLALRAVTDNRQSAIVSGVNIARIGWMAFILAGTIGAIAGFVIATGDGQITPKFGLWATLKGLIAMIIGGLGSLRGAVVGGLVLGIIEAQVQWYLGASLREVCVYALLFLSLVILPNGFFGAKHHVNRV